MINSVILEGRLTADPELKKTQSGKSLLTFTLATSEGKDRTQFTRCEAWNQNAEFLAQFGRKGSMVSIQGRIDNRTFQKDDTRQYMTVIVADRVNLLTRPNNAVESPEKPNFDTGEVNRVSEEDLPW